MSWLQKYPYALPGVLNALFLAITAAFVFFDLEETLKSRKGKFDLGLHLRSKLFSFLPSHLQSTQYSMLSSTEPLEPETPNPRPEEPLFKDKAGPAQKLPFLRIFTKNLTFTLITIAFFDFHLGAFTNLWSLFLSTPRSAADSPISLPLTFTGGLGMPAATVGLATSILGMLGMALQLFLYPTVHARLGTLTSFRYSLLLFPIAYLLAP